MCEPISDTIAIASFVMAAGSTAANVIGQNKQHKAVKNAAKDANTLEQNQISTREAQEEQSARHDIGLADDQAMSSEAMARLSAMEAGVTGNSADAVVGNVEAGRSRYVTSVRENQALTDQQLEEQRLGSDASMHARINGEPAADPLSAGLQIMGAGINTFSKIYDRRNPK
jgi:hypothetical protein